ncbi:MAG: hypothetical protein IJD39_11750, partial [Clostridia bacterium]|nr:hypothetical protein [Clostridia bacterium]
MALLANQSKKIPCPKWTVPRTEDREKKHPVVDKQSLHGLAPNFNWCEAIFKRNALEIVEID